MNNLRQRYRVIKHTYYEKCNVKSEKFSIEYFKRTWYGYRWTSVKELFVGWGDYRNETIMFNTESEAVFAIKKLEMGNIPDGWKREVTCELDFDKKKCNEI